MSPNPNDPRHADFWTPERREAARVWWTLERRMALALKRSANPIGNRSKAWWAAHPKAREAQRQRTLGRAGSMSELSDLFDQIDKAKARMRRHGGL